VRRKDKDVAKREKVDTVVKEKDRDGARERKISGIKTEDFSEEHKSLTAQRRIE